MSIRPRRASTVVAAALTGAAALVGGATPAAATTAPPNSSVGSEPAELDLQAPFWRAATAKCAGVLNNHLDRESETVDVFIKVLEAEANDEVPSAETIAVWTDLLTADVARSDAIRTDLADFEVVNPTHSSLWDTIVSAADEGVETQRARLVALETGEWQEIVDGFRSTMGQGGGSSAEAFEAIDASPLRGTDCAVVYTWRMPDDESVTPEFVATVAEVCVNVANRRLSSAFSDDAEISLSFLAEVIDAEAGVDVEIPAELGDALDRIVQEWELTVADFAAIDPALAPSAESWAEITAVPAERLAMFEGRRDAVASGDGDAILEAYDRSNFGPHPGWDWPLVGLDRRVCSSLQN